MKRIHSIICLSIYLLTLISCGRTDIKEISKYWWKYGEGYILNDFLMFDENNLKGDTIYSKNKPAALIKYCGTPIFQDHLVLEIKSLETNKIGRYHGKGLKSHFER